jgi:hypothetical protein
MGRNYREASRLDWQRKDGTEPNDYEELSVGCLQRIASATEAMAKPIIALGDEVRRERDGRIQAEQSLATEQRRTAALRGVIAKMRRSKT